MVITDGSINEYCENLALNEMSPATIKKYRTGIVKLQTFLKGEELTKEKLLEFRKKMQCICVSQTVNGYLSAINSYLLYQGRHELRLKMLHVQRQLFRAEEREMTEQEYERLVHAARRLKKHRLALILTTFVMTGIRVSELCYITVEAAKDGKAVVQMKGKIRTILIHRKLKRQLLDYAKKHGITSGCIFRTRYGNPLDRSNLLHEMKKICAAAHVNPHKVFPHNFRHLFAQMFYNVEKDLVRLADVLGHSSLETTRLYLSTTLKACLRALDKMSKVLMI